MTKSRRLAAHRASAAIDPDPADESEIPGPDEPDEDDQDQTEPTPEEREDSMTDTNQAAIDAAREEGRKAGYTEGFDASAARMKAVFASEHYAGRETAAADMLGTALSAEEITGLLAKYPKAAEAAAPTKEELEAAAEKAGREEMKAQLDKNGNSAIDAGTGAEGSDGKSDDSPKAKAQQILNDQAAFTGRKRKLETA